MIQLVNIRSHVPEILDLQDSNYSAWSTFLGGLPVDGGEELGRRDLSLLDHARESRAGVGRHHGMWSRSAGTSRGHQWAGSAIVAWAKLGQRPSRDCMPAPTTGRAGQPAAGARRCQSYCGSGNLTACASLCGQSRTWMGRTWLA
jgi:hypothetical protein